MYSLFKLHRSEEKWREETGLIFFTWSIINPNGPTINCVGVRNSGCPGQLEVFYRWLHFHGGESFVLGFVSEDSPNIPADIFEVLEYAFRQEPGRVITRFPLVPCIPSFITLPEGDAANKLIKPTDVKDLISNCRAFKEADWGREMYYLEKYGDRFFERAAEETRAALEQASLDPELTTEGQQFLEMTRLARDHLPNFKEWKPNQYVSRAFKESDSNIWWSTVTDNDFTTNCLIQIANAWVGSIYQVRHTIPSPAESYELVKDFLEFHKCYLWPEAWNSALLREQMGLE